MTNRVAGILVRHPLLREAHPAAHTGSGFNDAVGERRQSASS
jgi:hypothetical protein